jgi:hypothetical protein
MTDVSALDDQVLSAFLRFDELIAREVQRDRCSTCGGALDAAHFVRKPHVAGATLDDPYCLRFSFCCRVEGCRRRRTPPSVRFAGLVRAHAASIALALEGGANAPRRARLRLSHVLGVGERTILSWLKRFVPRLPPWHLHDALSGAHAVVGALALRALRLTSIEEKLFTRIEDLVRHAEN